MSGVIFVESFFDGYAYRSDGPYSIMVRNGRISEIEKGVPADRTRDVLPFVMPGLTEAHCHLFLNGGELDFTERSAYLKADFEEKIGTGRRNLAANRRMGITCLCDAGDNYGVNVLLQEENADSFPRIRQAEKGIRKTGRYGGFLSRAGSSAAEYEEYINTVSENGDVLKIVLTGIIDFDSGKVKGEPQFSQDELAFIVKKAGEKGLETMAHCSGETGLEMAIEAGVGSIEHGFFMKDRFLSAMRDKNIAWVPTFIPVRFQYDNPEYAGWNNKSLWGLERILAEHRENLLKAEKKGNLVFVGSDAGSFGVEHGRSYIEEMNIFFEAGIPLERILHWATVSPRVRWGMKDHSIKKGNEMEIISLERNPFEDITALLEEKEILDL